MTPKPRRRKKPKNPRDPSPDPIQTLKQHYDREENFREKNSQAIDAYFKPEFITFKKRMLREDVDATFKSLERAIDCRNFQISLLLDYLDANEMDLLTKNANYFVKVDRLIDLQRQRFKSIEETFQKTTHEMIEEADELKNAIDNASSVNYERLKAILTNHNAAFDKYCDDLRLTHTVKTLEPTGKFDESVQKMDVDVERVSMAMRESIEAIFREYQERNSDILKDYELIQPEQERNEKMIRYQENTIKKQIEQLEMYKKMSKVTMDKPINDLERERDELKSELEGYRRQLKVDDARDRQNIRELSEITNDCLGYLCGIHKKCRFIKKFYANLTNENLNVQISIVRRDVDVLNEKLTWVNREKLSLKQRILHELKAIKG